MAERRAKKSYTTENKTIEGENRHNAIEQKANQRRRIGSNKEKKVGYYSPSPQNS